MSKRKREIQKRKKLAEDARKDGNHQASEMTGDTEKAATSRTADPVPESFYPPESTIHDIPATPASPPRSVKSHQSRKADRSRQSVVEGSKNSWFGRNRENILLSLLVLYVLLLGLGTFGELFEIEWILNLPLFR